MGTLPPSEGDVNITDQLRAAGRDEKTAQAESEIFGAAFSRLAEREGVTPEELARMIKLEISKGEETDGGDARLEQRAYHGSPHRGIEKMSLQHIGTGEGNQVYGWGIYSAEEHGTAQAYRTTLAGPGYTVGGEDINLLIKKAEQGRDYVMAEVLSDIAGTHKTIEELRQEYTEENGYLPKIGRASCRERV